MEYNQLIDHTLLRADATKQEILNLCEEAEQWKFFSVCVNPFYIPLVKEKLSSLKSAVKICTVVGFPLGQTTISQKVYEAETAIQSGANEIDMVINVPELKLGLDYVVEEIREVKKVCRKHILKVIIETALLTEEEIARGTLAVMKGGADFVKTSTGFSKRGASVRDVEIMAETAKGRILIKAAGGIKEFADLKALVDAGANRIGTSRGVKLMEEWVSNK